MAQGYRPDRVGDQIRQELSEILSRGEVHDPGIGFITLTRVRVTPDLQLARVYYTSLGDTNARKETARALTRATGFFRRQIGSRLQLRRVPELEFRFDEALLGSRIPDPGSRPEALNDRPHRDARNTLSMSTVSARTMGLMAS